MGGGLTCELKGGDDVAFQIKNTIQQKGVYRQLHDYLESHADAKAQVEKLLDRDLPFNLPEAIEVIDSLVEEDNQEALEGLAALIKEAK